MVLEMHNLKSHVILPDFMTISDALWKLLLLFDDAYSHIRQEMH